jgi:tRNA(adenine34) deaminase
VTDAEFMDLALHHAEEAFARGDWPVAAVIVRDEAVLATGQNRQNTESDVTWHAEFEAIRTATRTHGASAWLARRSTRRWSRARCVPAR